MSEKTELRKLILLQRKMTPSNIFRSPLPWRMRTPSIVKSLHSGISVTIIPKQYWLLTGLHLEIMTASLSKMLLTGLWSNLIIYYYARISLSGKYGLLLSWNISSVGIYSYSVFPGINVWNYIKTYNCEHIMNICVFYG